jgi:HPt (histidine-containing phosphotransfer) domain-containing protein
MQGDRELCQAAGMDDYVSKPIRVEELIAALERSAARERVPSGPRPGRGGPGTAAGESPPPAVDLAVLDRLRQTLGGELGDLVATFAEDAGELVATMRRALADQDVPSFRRAAHSLGSNAAGFGARTLSSLARELETLAKSGSLEGAAAPLEQLAGECERVTRALQQVEP